MNTEVLEEYKSGMTIHREMKFRDEYEISNRANKYFKGHPEIHLIKVVSLDTGKTVFSKKRGQLYKLNAEEQRLLIKVHRNGFFNYNNNDSTGNILASLKRKKLIEYNESEGSWITTFEPMIWEW